MGLEQYKTKSGTFVPAWPLKIQTVIADVDKILDAIMQVNPLSYGRYQRNASGRGVKSCIAAPPTCSTLGSDHVLLHSSWHAEFGIADTRDVEMLQRKT